MKFTHAIYLLLLALFLGNTAALAQNVFFSQNFANGVPQGWTTTDASGQNVVWSWCNDPSAGRTSTNGCSPLFNDPINYQKPFASTTATNGFMTMDSDKPEELPKNHIAQLTSAAINCTGKKNVWVAFQSHIGVYDVAAETGAILRVSTNKTQWTNFTLFPGLDEDVRWSKNPEESYVDISTIADDQATVYLQWQWTGNYEYFWNLDDVVLAEGNPALRNNLVLNDFFYPASNFKTPKGAIAKDTFAFRGYFSNRGLNKATNIKLAAYVEDANKKVLFKDEMIIPEVLSDINYGSNLTKTFAPELPVGRYTIRYTLSSDSIDQRPDDNVLSSSFVVTDENVFAKEEGEPFFARPPQDVQWTIGNLYTIPSGTKDKFKATEVEFAFATDDDLYPANEVIAAISFLQVKDEVPANYFGFDSDNFPGSSVDVIGTADYDAVDSVENGDLQRVTLFNTLTGDIGIPLVAGKRYFACVTYPTDYKETKHAFVGDIKYIDVVSTVAYSDQWYLAGIGPEFAAVLRLYFDLTSTTDEKALPTSVLNIAPNPISEVLNLMVQFDQPTDATITIADMSGRIIRYENRSALLNETIRYQDMNLPSGTYLARIATDAGTRTLKFSVAK
jgi:hypothetical protein